MLLGSGWLDLTGTEVVVTRVRDLGAALDGSVYRLAAYDWIVVPEPLFGRPALKALSFTERIRADHWSFGGNLGYDYEIYAPPRLPHAASARIARSPRRCGMAVSDCSDLGTIDPPCVASP